MPQFYHFHSEGRMTAQAAERKDYAVSCAGCNERRVFATVQELADWTTLHKCWERGNG